MRKFVYKLAFFVALTTLVLCLLSGITLVTSFLRSIVVFFGTLVVAIAALNVLRWGLLSKPKPVNEMKSNEK